MSARVRIILTALLLTGGIVSPAVAVENVAGLFAIGASARALGLGGAFCALADDEGGVFHNPAGLGQLEGINLSTLFVQQFGGVSFGTVTVGVPYVGVSVLVLDSGLIPTADGSIRYSSQGVVGSAGVPLGPVGLGVRWRLFRLSSPFEGQGWALDPAVLIATETIRIGFIFEGAISSPVAYEGGAEEAFDRSLRLGAALALEPADDVRWNATFEAGGLFSGGADLAAGLEAWIGGLGARVGFDGEGPTFGLSLRFETLELDWAYTSRADLGGSHRVALALRF